MKNVVKLMMIAIVASLIFSCAPKLRSGFHQPGYQKMVRSDKGLIYPAQKKNINNQIDQLKVKVSPTW